MTGILPAQYVARILDQRILESTAGAKKRLSGFTHPAECVKHAGIISIGATGHHPDGVAELQFWLIQSVSGDPLRFSGDIQPAGSTFNSKGNSLMGNRIGAVVTNQR